MANRGKGIEIARFDPPPDPETGANDTAGEAGAERNSAFRKIIDEYLTRILKPLIDKYPIDPNAITVFSTALVSMAALVKALTDETKDDEIVSIDRKDLYLMLGMVVGATGDKLDGVVARILEGNGVERDADLGQLLDAVADRA